MNTSMFPASGFVPIHVGQRRILQYFYPRSLRFPGIHARALIESISAVRGWIAKRLLARYHLGNHPPRGGTESETPMRMADGEPETSKSWCATDHWTGIRKAWPAPKPGLSLSRFA
jgi:hypothetical protein